MAPTHIGTSRLMASDGYNRASTEPIELDQALVRHPINASITVIIFYIQCLSRRKYNLSQPLHDVHLITITTASWTADASLSCICITPTVSHSTHRMFLCVLEFANVPGRIFSPLMSKSTVSSAERKSQSRTFLSGGNLCAMQLDWFYYS